MRALSPSWRLPILAGLVCALLAAPAQAAGRRVLLHVPASSVPGRTVRVTGRLTGPPVKHATVVLQLVSGHAQRPIAHGRLTRDGRFTLVFKAALLARGAHTRAIAPSMASVRASVRAGGRTLATSAVERIALTPTPVLTPLGPAPTPTPVLTPLTPTPTPSPELPRTYVVTYEGHAAYVFHRRNSGLTGGTVFSSTFDQHSDLTWTTTFAPVQIGPGAPINAGDDRVHGLKGTASSDKDIAVGDAHSHDHCDAYGPDDRGDYGEDYGHPQVTVAPDPDGRDADLTVQATSHMEYEATTCAVSTEKLTLIDPSEDPTVHGDATSDNVLDDVRVVSYQALRAATPSSPLVLQVREPATRDDVDCHDASLWLVECNSDLTTDATLTIAPAP